MTKSTKTNKQACNSKSEFQSLHQPIVALRPVKRPNVILITNGQCIIEHIGAKKKSPIKQLCKFQLLIMYNTYTKVSTTTD